MVIAGLLHEFAVFGLWDGGVCRPWQGTSRHADSPPAHALRVRTERARHHARFRVVGGRSPHADAFRAQRLWCFDDRIEPIGRGRRELDLRGQRLAFGYERVAHDHFAREAWDREIIDGCEQTAP